MGCHWRGKGAKTGNENREPRLITMTKNGKQRIKETKTEKKREIKVYPVPETVNPVSAFEITVSPLQKNNR